jgi:hypothetical protein
MHEERDFARGFWGVWASELAEYLCMRLAVGAVLHAH